MFRRLTKARGRSVGIFIDGAGAQAREGDSVAAALLAAGCEACRVSAVSGAPRNAYCLMGVCFDCLVTIDGAANRQGCLVAVREGMRIDTGRGKRTLADGIGAPASSRAPPALRERYDVAVIGAGPAGLAAAQLCAAAGLDCALFDEQTSPGGQIYRAVTASPLAPGTLLGRDYWEGAAL